VALYLIGDRCIVVESFNDEAVTASLELPAPPKVNMVLVLPVGGKVTLSGTAAKIEFTEIPPRTLVALTLY
jgi:hypothetical protein